MASSPINSDHIRFAEQTVSLSVTLPVRRSPTPATAISPISPSFPVALHPELPARFLSFRKPSA
jgi:hypothetical protein